jgi:hypothetical protein
MARKTVPSTREYRTGLTNDSESYTENHPAYGVVGIVNVTSTGHALAGSDVKHHSYVTLRISKARLMHDLHRTYPYATERVIEVEMTHAQFAQMITTPNQGEGVLCTLSEIGKEEIPGVVLESRYAESAQSTRNAINKSMEDIREAEAKLAEAIKGGKIGEIKKAHSWLQTKISHLPSNVDFAQKMLNEFTEKVVSNAKTEVEATLNAAVRHVGLQAVAAGAELPQIGS